MNETPGCRRRTAWRGVERERACKPAAVNPDTVLTSGYQPRAPQALAGRPGRDGQPSRSPRLPVGASEQEGWQLLPGQDDWRGGEQRRALASPPPPPPPPPPPSLLPGQGASRACQPTAPRCTHVHAGHVRQGQVRAACGDGRGGGHQGAAWRLVHCQMEPPLQIDLPSGAG